MENEDNHADADTQSVGTDENADANVSDVSIRDTINTATGRDYKTDEEAIKGVKETTSYVGLWFYSYICKIYRPIV